MMNKKITIVGGGLAGIMLSIYLAKRGYKVDVYEKRSHPSFEPKDCDQKKTASVDLSFRGILALKKIEMDETVLSYSLPMTKRHIYLPSGLKFLPFGHDGFPVYTLSRQIIHKELVKKAESFGEINLYFDQKFICFDPLLQEATIFDINNKMYYNLKFDLLIGTDGVNSAVRESLKQISKINFKKELIFNYKEFSVDKISNKLDKTATHMWPRENCLFVLHPNIPDSFTGTFLFPSKKNKFFSELTYPSKKNLFQTYYPDIAALFPKFSCEFFSNPLGSIHMVTAEKWSAEDKVLLIGDSAHAMVPYFGQGMNCAFEDCYLLDSYLEKFDDNWTLTIARFEKERKKDAQAISQLSLENCPGWTCEQWERFIYIRQIEKFVVSQFDDFISYHHLVYFDNMAFNKIIKLKALQIKLFDSISKIIKPVKTIPKKN